MKKWGLPILWLLAIASASATPPPLREQISLNGDWPVGGHVPVYEGLPGLDERVYERDVAVPSDWTGRVVKIEFGAVNFIAHVFVDGAPAAEHVGGWCPFAVDVSRWVQPGRTFHLRVIVQGPKHPPISDETGAVAWPVGGWSDRGGIADDVWLRAYGEVHIEDAFIQTSVARKEITVDYTVSNASAKRRNIVIHGEAAGAKSGEVARRFASPVVMLEAGETKLVHVTADWAAPELYWPDHPALYQLSSQIEEGGAVLDRETRRFGFREITIEGNQFRWNGVRINLYGDYQVFGDTWYLDSARLHTPEAWPATVDRMKAMNLRVIRWHHNPVPQYVLDVCDEKGLLVCDEAANYARDFHRQSDRPRYLANARHTLEPWIRADRNHPSVYLWNATNEMTHSFAGPFDPSALAGLGREIARFDPTRPVGYDGDTGRPNATGFSTRAELTKGRVTDARLVDYHYPEGYNREPAGSIYDWARLVFPDEPTGAGELLHTRSPLPEVQTAVERNTWWLGIWLRGLRHANWTNVKPACWWFTDGDLASANPAQRQRSLNLRNALAPVALFDKAYDDLGIAPYVTGVTPGGQLPVVEAGQREARTLVLYNDEFAGTDIALEVLVRVDGRVLASGGRRCSLALGDHVELPYAFEVPRAAGREMELVLRTYKNDRLKFEETRRFAIRAGAGPGKQTASDRVEFIESGGTPPATTTVAENAIRGDGDGWQALLDPALTQWEKFIGVPHGSLGLAGVPADSDGMKGAPLGLNRDPLHVFTVEAQDGEPVLHVGGQVYGGLTTKAALANYHLRLQFRWGEKKFAPRLTQRRDSGLLYHASGPHGAFWNVWKRSVEFQIEETNMGDLYALAGAAGTVPVVRQGKTWRYDPAGRAERIVTADGVTMFTARHRPGSFERVNGEWNTLELVVLGRTAIHLVNGKVVLVARSLATLAADGSETPLSGGQIQLQSEGAEAFFRRIEWRPITEIPADIQAQLAEEER